MIAYSISGLAREMEVHRQTLTVRLRKVKPAKTVKGRRMFTLAQGVAALDKQPLRQRGSEAVQAGKALLVAEMVRRLRISSDARMAELIPAETVRRQNQRLRELFGGLGAILLEKSDEVAMRQNMDPALTRSILAEVGPMFAELLRPGLEEL